MSSDHVSTSSLLISPTLDHIQARVINCAVIGYGYWGRILSARISIDPRYELNVICDRSRARRDDPSFPARARFTVDLEDALSSPDVEAIFIATPPSTHHAIAERALACNKHVWLEKPCCASRGELDSLIALASERELALYLDLIMVSNPIIRSLSARVTALKGLKSREDGSHHRHKLSMWRENAGHVGSRLGDPLDIIYDLGVHDLSVVKLLYPELSADEFTLEMELERIAEDAPYPHTLLKLSSTQVVVEIQLSWLAPEKRREIEWSGAGSTLTFRLEQAQRGDERGDERETSPLNNSRAPATRATQGAHGAQGIQSETLYERSDDQVDLAQSREQSREQSRAEREQSREQSRERAGARLIQPEQTGDAISNALSAFTSMVDQLRGHKRRGERSITEAHVSRTLGTSLGEPSSEPHRGSLRGSLRDSSSSSPQTYWDIAHFVHRVIERLRE